ncbi:MAG: hypothetical protein A4E62_00699 [Syntrophorhabdus sp. PtaU1.Bin002]|nr:MAG: hypothetical protein A4E58_02477 [Syntrophorhabdus sp. PtaB.Bin006]OPY72990.1 MAG: hypothetical protein A4E62_00699 [Syntrophorhabdus sp. PtaU1.Bin002]
MRTPANTKPQRSLVKWQKTWRKKLIVQKFRVRAAKRPKSS